MKKIALSAAVMALTMMGCSESGLDNSVASTSEVNDSRILPYFIFAKNGARLDENGAEKKMERSTLVLDDNESFGDLKKKYSEKLESDSNYYWGLERPANYFCDDALLAINSEYETVVSSSGDSLLTDYSLYKGCKALSDYPVIQKENGAKHKTLNKLVVNDKQFYSNVIIQDGDYMMLGQSYLDGVPNAYYGAGSTAVYQYVKRNWVAIKPNIYNMATACIKGSTCGWDELGFFCNEVDHFQRADTRNIKANFSCRVMPNTEKNDIGTVSIHAAVVNAGTNNEITFMVATKSTNVNDEWGAAISQVYINDIYGNH